MSKVKGKRIGDIVNFKRGYDLPASARLFGKYPVISSGGVSGYHSEFKKDGEGIITGRYGTLGEVYYVNGKYWPHNTTLYATNFHGNYPKYVFYLMKCLGNLKTSDKSTVPGINRNDLHELVVPYVECKKQQQKIASILSSSLDEKIELNNKINAELEIMAKTLYEYWFVQFDFPGVDGRPYKSSGGKMVYYETLKREIPEGWEVKSLGEINSTLVRGISPTYTEEDGIPVINQKCIRNNTIDFRYCRFHDKKSKSVTKTVMVGDILVNSTGVGTLGRVAIVKRLEKEITTVDSHVTIVRINPDLANTFYVGYNIQNKQSEIEQLGEGSTGQTELSRENLAKLKILLPNELQQKSFANIVKPFVQKIAVNEIENRHLAQLRDWLLPMLMNGQVTVGEAYEQVEEALSMAAEPETTYKL